MVWFGRRPKVPRRARRRCGEVLLGVDVRQEDGGGDEMALEQVEHGPSGLGEGSVARRRSGGGGLLGGGVHVHYVGGNARQLKRRAARVGLVRVEYPVDEAVSLASRT
jgi:hypothetical protein